MKRSWSIERTLICIKRAEFQKSKEVKFTVTFNLFSRIKKKYSGKQIKNGPCSKSRGGTILSHFYFVFPNKKNIRENKVKTDRVPKVGGGQFWVIFTLFSRIKKNIRENKVKTDRVPKVGGVKSVQVEKKLVSFWNFRALKRLLLVKRWPWLIFHQA